VAVCAPLTEEEDEDRGGEIELGAWSDRPRPPPWQAKCTNS